MSWSLLVFAGLYWSLLVFTTDEAVRTLVYTPAADAANGAAGSTLAVVNEPFGGQTRYALEPLKDAWSSRTDPENVTTARTVDPARRRLENATTGRVQESFTYDAMGNLATAAVAGGPAQEWSHVNLDMEGANLLERHALLGSGGATTRIFHTEPEKRGLVKSATDPCGNKSDFTYGELNADGGKDFLLSTTDARLETWSVTKRSAFGHPRRRRGRAHAA